MKRSLSFMLFSLCFHCYLAAQMRIFPNSPTRETRAVWVTTYSSLDWPTAKATDEMGRNAQKQSFCNMLDRLRDAGINTVLLQTRVRGTVIYPSSIEPWDACLTGTMGVSPGYDPLKMAVDECHKRGMQLHAWIVALPYCNQKLFKTLKAKSKNLPRTITHEGNVYLDPSDERTSEYLAGICSEIVTKYDVDGISLDYIRYPDNPKRLSDASAYRRLSNGLSLDNWRRKNITRIVQLVYETVKAKKPWVRVTSSPVGKHDDLARYRSGGWNARSAVYQDVQEWMRTGIHDGIFPMMYFRGDNFYPFALDWQENSYGCDIAPGMGIYFLSPREKNWPLEDITRELEFLRANRMGQCFFRARFLLDNVKGLYDWLSLYHNRQLALPVPMERYKDIIPEAPDPHFTIKSTNQVEITWDKDDELTYNIYMIDGDDEILLSAAQSENRIVLSLADLFPVNRKIGIKAMNRYGNESKMIKINVFK